MINYKIMIILFIILLIPLKVKANIVCNDGTMSSSCYDCHQGCCSHHGGCVKNNNNDYNYIGENTTGAEDNNFGMLLLVGAAAAGIGTAVGYSKSKEK